MSATDRNEIEQYFTGEITEPEPIEDALGRDPLDVLLEDAHRIQELRQKAPTYAEGLVRLRGALDSLTEAVYHETSVKGSI